MEDFLHHPVFQEIVELVQRELNRLVAQRPSRAAALQEEKRQIQLQFEGWTKSLGRPDLDDSIRLSLEQSWKAAKQRLAEVDQDLIDEEIVEQRKRVVLDPQEVADGLGQLESLLGTDNATLVNFELALHIDEIRCSPDGRIEMRTCKLGIVPDVVGLIREANGSLHPSTGSGDHQAASPRRGRRRTRLALNGDDRKRRAELMEFALDPQRFTGLPPQFFWTDFFDVPKRITWPEEHAEEVYRRKQETGQPNVKLAAEFGVSLPTLRQALKLGRNKAEGTA
jgi:hypothetical protein